MSRDGTRTPARPGNFSHPTLTPDGQCRVFLKGIGNFLIGTDKYFNLYRRTAMFLWSFHYRFRWETKMELFLNIFYPINVWEEQKKTTSDLCNFPLDSYHREDGYAMFRCSKCGLSVVANDVNLEHMIKVGDIPAHSIIKYGRCYMPPLRNCGGKK